MEIEPFKISNYLFQKTKLTDWIFTKINKPEEFDNNTFYAGEILSILLSNSVDN